jgi:hypothetical protein
MGKHKFFCWMLLRDRLNTGELLKRKNMEQVVLEICAMQASRRKSDAPVL